MNPKHIDSLPKKRQSFAPYNFIDLPDEEQVVLSQELPQQNIYYPQRHTGYIQCTLVTESPLYIRTGLLLNDFKNFGNRSCNLEELAQLTPKEQERWTDFFHNPASNRPVIPGSSLRGMIRTIVEIVTYSKINKVSGHQKLFFRAVAAPRKKEGDPDPLAGDYENKLGKNGSKVKAGYLSRQTDGSWRIYKPKTVKEQSFVWIKESIVLNSDVNLIGVNDIDYHPQTFKVRFDEIDKQNNRYVAQEISTNDPEYQYQGYLVTSGNMIEGNPEATSPRQYHCLIGEKTDQYLEIDRAAIADYCAALTDFQKKDPFDEQAGILKDGNPVFYSEPKDGKKVNLFGHSPNFRVPYTPHNKNNRAASVTDFIPPKMKSCDNSTIDISEAIFGWVKDKKLDNQACAGRVFITDAVVDSQVPDDKIWCQENREDRITPKILATPKPTTFQNYLVQTDPKGKRENLKHYGSNPIQDTVIRGHKLYWHQKNVSCDSVKETKKQEEIEKKAKQYTKIRPISSAVHFNFIIYFENLTDEELGALLWVLDLAKQKENRLYVKDDREYRFSLGMGKPFGMGAVKLSNQQLWLSQRKQKRYQQLFDGNKWEIGDYNDTQDEAEILVDSFKRYILGGIGENPDGNLEDVQRIKMLLKMLSFPGKSRGSVRYMEIEHPHNDNEYKERRILPNPFQVGGE
ncbi:MAG: TIGR03986 family CRISPR-associated RAMP protein [Symploca sp. SIO3E6]|nr:TIGR03986 family CRISPR-associated RAMP protein [Caldora sp. SIO3E6]